MLKQAPNVVLIQSDNCYLSLARLWLAFHAKGVVSPVVLLLSFFSTNDPCGRRMLTYEHFDQNADLRRINYW